MRTCVLALAGVLALATFGEAAGPVRTSGRGTVTAGCSNTKLGTFRVATVGRSGYARYRDQCGVSFRSTTITRVRFLNNVLYRYAALFGRGIMNGRRIRFEVGLGDDTKWTKDRFFLRLVDSRGSEAYETVGVIQSGVIVVRR